MAKERTTLSKDQMAKKSPRRHLFTLIKGIISAALIYYLLNRTNLSEIWAAVKSADPWILLLSFSLHAVGYYASAYRWRVLALAQEMDLPVSYLVESYAVAMFFNNILPSTIGGDAVRAYDSWRKGFPKLKSIATVGVERFIGMFALVVFAIIAVALTREIGQHVPLLWLWVVLCFVLMWLVLQGIFLQQGKARILAKIFNLPGFGIFRKIVNKFSGAFVNLRGKNKALVVSLLLSLLLQINVIFHYFLISRAMGLHVPFMKFWIIIPIALFLQMIPLSINGIGIRENLFVFLLGLYGVTTAQAIAFSWIAYAMILALGIFGGVLYIFRKEGKIDKTFLEKESEMATTETKTREEILDTQKELLDQKTSAMAKYQELVLGKKGLWNLLKFELVMTLTSWVPGALGLVLRKKLYPLILGSCGRNVVFGVNIAIRHPHKIHIGDNVVIDDHCVLDAKGDGNKGIKIGNGVFVGRNTILTCHDGDIILEDNVNIGFNCVISSLGSIVIKENHLMAAFCYLVGGDHVADRTDVPVLYQGRTATGIVLEENIWLGAGVAILDGSHVGRDSIIGAHAVVNGNIDPYSIAVGIPAKTIRDRRKNGENKKEK
ncbi:MAG: flippase-like domain-containing protein [Calditrichaeota bacterium]|nr:flippase-like domain-containing protein [Calditrichota bacterium]